MVRSTSVLRFAKLPVVAGGLAAEGAAIPAVRMLQRRLDAPSEALASTNARTYAPGQ
jgi:hypothetical protein